MFKLGKKVNIEGSMSNREGEGVVNERKDVKLYIVTDRPKHGLINYFMECGINVSNVFTSIVDARNEILMQLSDHTRIVILDTGTGKFTSTKMRQELIDLIGICDVTNKVTVFYTDSVLKVDTLKVLKDSAVGIDWFEYKNTLSVILQLLSYNENYVADADIDNNDREMGLDELYDIRGSSINCECHYDNLEVFTPDEIIQAFSDESNLIPGYDIEY